MTAALEGGEWSAARLGRTLSPGKDPVPILQEAGWAPGPVWTGGKSRPHRDSIPDRPPRSSVTIPTELPGPRYSVLLFVKYRCKSIFTENLSNEEKSYIYIYICVFVCYLGRTIQV